MTNRDQPQTRRPLSPEMERLQVLLTTFGLWSAAAGGLVIIALAACKVFFPER